MTTIKEKIKEKLVKVVWTYAKKTIKDTNEESTSHGQSVKKEKMNGGFVSMFRPLYSSVV